MCLKFIDLLEQHLFCGIKQIDVPVYLLIQLRDHIVVHLHCFFHLIELVLKFHLVIDPFLLVSSMHLHCSLNSFDSRHDFVVNRELNVMDSFFLRFFELNSEGLYCIVEANLIFRAHVSDLHCYVLEVILLWPVAHVSL